MVSGVPLVFPGLSRNSVVMGGWLFRSTRLTVLPVEAEGLPKSCLWHAFPIFYMRSPAIHLAELHMFSNSRAIFIVFEV